MHPEDERAIKSPSEEYHVFENGIGYRLKKYREECTKDLGAKEEKRISGFEGARGS